MPLETNVVCSSFCVGDFDLYIMGEIGANLFFFEVVTCTFLILEENVSKSSGLFQVSRLSLLPRLMWQATRLS